MAFDPADPGTWPPRMLTSEVAQVMRLSKATVLRRNRDGSLGFRHIDRGAALIFAKADLERATAKSAGEEPVPEPTWDRPDRAAFRAAHATRRGRSRPIKPDTSPSTSDETAAARAFGLAIRPGVRVDDLKDGSFVVSYVRSRNHRPEGWPPVVRLPLSRPGPVRLDDDAQFEAIVADLANLVTRWRKAAGTGKRDSKAR